MEKSSLVNPLNARQRILDAAVNVLAQHGYTGAGVQEIVDVSGTSKGSFYFHFSSKEKMVMALVDRMSEKLIKATLKNVRNEPTPLGRVVTGIGSLLSTFSKRRKIAHVLLINVLGHGKSNDMKFLPMREKFSTFIKIELDNAISVGQIEPQDTELIAHMWFGAIYEIIMRWLIVGQPNPLTDATNTLILSLLRSVGAPDQYLELS
ncbi:MAG: DNA-binding transcriptional regulator, AcrR family [Chloroflexi bacterium]|nr:MAG: DNA-binding transcriptional regulator, AcrR family [Chloroflexota bacterium]